MSNWTFEKPATPGDSLRLLNEHMRTSLLKFVHDRMNELKDHKDPRSPLEQLIESLKYAVDCSQSEDILRDLYPNPFGINRLLKIDFNDVIHDVSMLVEHCGWHIDTLIEINGE